MLVEKTDSEMVSGAIPVNGIVPFASLVRSRVSGSGFKRVSASDLGLLREFYVRLHGPPADLNALMMVAWRHALDLHFLIEDDVLYVVANWEGGPMLWGPPLGK